MPKRETAPDKTLVTGGSTLILVSNLLENDADALNYWLKTVTGCWAKSLQFSAGGEKALARMNGYVKEGKVQ